MLPFFAASFVGVSNEITCLQLKLNMNLSAFTLKLSYNSISPCIGSQAFCRIIDDSVKEISELKALVEDGACISQLGQKSDQICNTVSPNLSTLHMSHVHPILNISIVISNLISTIIFCRPLRSFQQIAPSQTMTNLTRQSMIKR